MLGPGDLLRLPADVVVGIRRAVDEVITIRMLLERAVKLMEVDLSEDLDELKGEFAHVRKRVDEIADTIPTVTRGPVEKVKDALTPD